ncbi:hypothetical protein K1T71_012056 [Dendrolimus kikuchii]|uniref:Uncharacterized protein n=1 Tax=Dendrolimus kikuchii TaxID=765133 RepID=A0ACC1CKG8_9NEOP|nr:hypothetical protein K1T71_012056 [Dendrolimus kikuchii]
MKRIVNQAIAPVYSKFEQLENKITTCTTITSDSGGNRDMTQGVSSVLPPNLPTEPAISPSLLYCHGLSLMNGEKPKYPSKNKHPVTFIEDLTAYLKKLPINRGNEIELIIECLEGETRNWARIYKNRWSRFEDFKRDFLDTYWGEAEQSELRRKIVHNVWDNTKSTMLSHFIELCGQAKMLTYPIQEKQLISDIMHHYPKDVQFAWTNNRSASLLEAAEFLRKLDDINKGDEQNQQGTSIMKGYNGTTSTYRRQNQKKPYQNKRYYAKRAAERSNETGVNLVAEDHGNYNQMGYDYNLN